MEMEKEVKQIHVKYVYVTLLLIVLQFVMSCKKEDKPLATFDGGRVTQGEYIELYLASTEHKPNKLPDIKNLKKLVTRIAMEKIPVLEAKKYKIQNDSSFINGFKRIEYSFLYTPYISETIGNKIITDSLIRLFYNHYSPQYKLLYIEIPFSSKDKQTKKDTIDNIYKKLLKGIPFGKISDEIKKNAKKGLRTGDYGWVINESIGNDKLRAAMRKLNVKSFSEPIETEHEFQIIYKADKRDVPVPDFDEVKERIRGSLINTRKEKLEEAVNERLSKLKEKYHYKLDHAFIKEIKKKVIHHISKKYFKYDFEVLSQEDMNRYIASYDGGGVRLKELFERRHKRPDNMFEFRDRLDVMARLHLFGKDALALGLDKLPKYKNQLDRVYDRYLGYTITSRNIEKQLAVKVDSLKKLKNMDQLAINREKALIKRDIKKAYEKKLRKKYHYKYITDNFDSALKEALRQKRIQIENNASRAR